jgi:hypothetical protein
MKLRGLKSTIFVVFAVKNDGMSARKWIALGTPISATKVVNEIFLKVV